MVVEVGVVFAISKHSVDFGNHESEWGRQGDGVAKSPGSGLSQASIQIIKEQVS